MNRLAHPVVLAALVTLLAALVHPALRASEWLPAATTALPALALLTALGFSLRGGWLAALGAATLIAALGHDAVRGHEGSVTLVPGQATQNFEERGPGGARLGLRPLGFSLRLDAIGTSGEVTLTTDAGRVAVEPGRAAEVGGFRLGAPRTAPTGDATLLRLSVSGGGETRQVDLVPGEVVRTGDLALALESYYPDFALDEKQQPFSRSKEHLSPAALLQVTRGNQAWRVFVIRSLPGIHQQPGLDRSFTLASVEPEIALTLSVTRQPSAPFVVGGLLVIAVSLARRA